MLARDEGGAKLIPFRYTHYAALVLGLLVLMVLVCVLVERRIGSSRLTGQLGKIAGVLFIICLLLIAVLAMNRA